MIDRLSWYLILLITALFVVTAQGQSSSLFVTDADQQAPPLRTVNGRPSRLSPAIAQTSLTAVPPIEPRQFATNDLIGIIIRESTQSKSIAELETEKETTLQGAINAIPNLRLKDLLDLQLQASANDDPPVLDLKFSNEFEGEGDYVRRDNLTGRIMAKIIDVKPNGNLVLEARKYIKQDDETMNIVLTGTCRSLDIAADNTILSTQIFDMHLRKEHTGELRKATKKGILTKIFEAVFNF